MAFSYLSHSQSLYGGDSSECTESVKQPSPTEMAEEQLCIMSCKMTVHVILTYPPWASYKLYGTFVMKFRS